jgi:hypothetical protein
MTSGVWMRKTSFNYLAAQRFRVIEESISFTDRAFLSIKKATCTVTKIWSA